jgi:hypothetical protein
MREKGLHCDEWHRCQALRQGAWGNTWKQATESNAGGASPHEGDQLPKASLAHPQEVGQITLFVKPPNAHIIQLIIDRNGSVKDLKQLIEAASATPVSSQLLIWNGKLLTDEHRLGDQRLNNLDTIIVILTLQGGSQNKKSYKRKKSKNNKDEEEGKTLANKKQMIGEGQNSRHGMTQGINNDNSSNEAAQPSQEEELCPFHGCSKLLVSLSRYLNSYPICMKNITTWICLCTPSRAMGLRAATSARSTCGKGGA